MANYRRKESEVTCFQWRGPPRLKEAANFVLDNQIEATGITLGSKGFQLCVNDVWLCLGVGDWLILPNSGLAPFSCADYEFRNNYVKIPERVVPQIGDEFDKWWNNFNLSAFNSVKLTRTDIANAAYGAGYMLGTGAYKN